MPSQTFLHRVVVPAPPDRVWKGLQKPESWGRIGGVSNVEQATFDASGDITGYRFSVALGGNLHMGAATRSAVAPGRRVAMGIATDQLKGEIDVELEPWEGQTAVTVTMTVHSKGFMAAMLFPVITGAIASGFNEEVERFASGLVEDPASSPEQMPEPDFRPQLDLRPQSDLPQQPHLRES